MAFVTLFVSILINLLLRVRVPDGTSGPLFDFNVFEELSYIFFCVGSFLVYCAVYFAIYYMSARLFFLSSGSDHDCG